MSCVADLHGLLCLNAQYEVLFMNDAERAWLPILSVAGVKGDAWEASLIGEDGPFQMGRGSLERRFTMRENTGLAVIATH